MRSPRALAAAAALVLAALMAQPPAVRAEETPSPPTGAPVTLTESVTVAADGATEIDVLANDNDPDAATNDSLTVCRLEPSANLPINVAESTGYDETDYESGGHPVLSVFPFDAKPGTYTIDYYVCDYDYLTPATLTVRVIGPQDPFAHIVQSRPGHVRFRNPGQRRTVIRYGSKDGRTVDGKFALAPHTAKTVRITRRAIQWTATIRTPFGSSSSGHTLTGITQPARPSNSDSPRPIAYTMTDQTAWRLGTRQIELRSHREATQQPGSDTADRDESTDAPATAQDEVKVSQGFFEVADVLDNDVAPDATAQDDLAICRASAPKNSGLEVTPIAGDSFVIFTAGRERARQATTTLRTTADPMPYSLLVQASNRTAMGTYTLTYYACNRQYLTPSTLTVTVTKSQRVTARKLEGRPGVVRFHNPGPHAARVVVRPSDQFGEPGRPTPIIARFKLPADTTKRVRPDARTIYWSATSRRGPGGFGVIGRIACLRC